MRSCRRESAYFRTYQRFRIKRILRVQQNGGKFLFVRVRSGSNVLVEFWLNIFAVIMPSPEASGDLSDVASRYIHLLQPIRDLTKNWDIDVAAQLEEYLAEVNSFNVLKLTVKFMLRSQLNSNLILESFCAILFKVWCKRLRLLLLIT